jgi:hypothetical protein
MNLEFNEILKNDAIDLYMCAPEGQEWDVTVREAHIKWNIKMDVCSWGIDTFNYKVGNILMQVSIETIQDDDVEVTELFFEIKPDSKSNKYLCRIYEEKFEDNKLIEDVYNIIPLKFNIEEKAMTDMGKRTQVCLKYLELNLEGEEKSFTLTI